MSRGRGDDEDINEKLKPWQSDRGFCRSVGKEEEEEEEEEWAPAHLHCQPLSSRQNSGHHWVDWLTPSSSVWFPWRRVKQLWLAGTVGLPAISIAVTQIDSTLTSLIKDVNYIVNMQSGQIWLTSFYSSSSSSITVSNEQWNN